MPVQSRWVKYKSYSGYVAKGGPKILDPVNPALHIDRAVWLSGQLEAVSWGTVQGYDGCAMSGGILHNIAVSPKDLTQGTFFELLYAISTVAVPAFSEVAAQFKGLTWKITADGKLRYESGNLVPGRVIRREFSGAEGGNVGRTGLDSIRAKLWAERFFTLFSTPATYKAQSDYAAKWLASGNSADEMAVYRHYLPATNLDSMIGIPASGLPPEVEMAMSVYHSFSVNAPGIARGILSPIVRNLKNLPPERFAARLIRGLGKKQYANWMDEPADGSNRYDKTRMAVWSRPDLWEGKMARALMPRDL